MIFFGFGLLDSSFPKFALDKAALRLALTDFSAEFGRAFTQQVQSKSVCCVFEAEIYEGEVKVRIQDFGNSVFFGLELRICFGSENEFLRSLHWTNCPTAGR